ncbi:unnamed protein product [Anisakis simplex]|uniref:Histone-lysine N-methyltransferase n=1 Tax=Anisakis simplex TaxID=6269 RepID=A0A3P6RHN0_ANISI|nr:unnamed protein product [Anisakis simplex]
MEEKGANEQYWQMRKCDWQNECFVCAMRHFNDELYNQSSIDEDLLNCSACKTKFHKSCFLSFREGYACIRSYCECYFNGLSTTQQKQHKDDYANGHFICEACEYHDYPRIGDYVLATSKGYLWPAKTLHADLLPTGLFRKIRMVERLQQPGYVLIQWVEGLKVPNYDVVSFRDIVPFPNSLDCPVWKRFKSHKNVLNAVKELFKTNGINFGIDRPLPAEVEQLKAPQYKKIQVSINGKLAKVNAEELGQCTCEGVNGQRCTAVHSCLNRSIHVECPKGQDLTEYVGRVMPKDEYFDELNFIGTFNNLEMSYFGMQLTSEYYVDARNCGNMSRSVNHSCEPNCTVNAVTVDGICRLKVTALRDIEPGEEITYDYGTMICDGMVGMRCRCGAVNCRGTIGKLVNVGGNRKENNSSSEKVKLFFAFIKSNFNISIT